MGSGGFHGGSSHSGGHHSSGGGFSGGFSGGGGHHSGGGYHGGSSGGDSGLGGMFGIAVKVVIVLIASAVSFLCKVAEGSVPGLNLVNLGIFCVSAVFFFLGLKEYDRTEILNEFKKEYQPKIMGHVWKGDYSSDKLGDKQTWVDEYRKQYRIAFFDREYGEENTKAVREMMERTPRILWMKTFTWLWIGIISFISTFFFYELVIPIFENMIMTDFAFAFIDELVFYLPSVITLSCSIACFVIVKIKDDLLYKCAVRIVNDIFAAEKRVRTESFIASQLSKKWYYNYCPNCGAEASRAIRSCTYCGTSLEVKSFENTLVGAVHLISADAENDSGKEKQK